MRAMATAEYAVMLGVILVLVIGTIRLVGGNGVELDRFDTSSTHWPSLSRSEWFSSPHTTPIAFGVQRHPGL
jgi:hypothetical protein